LIVAARVGRAVRWRDCLITLLIWLLVAILLVRELGVVVHDSVRWLIPGARIDWHGRLRELFPFLVPVAALAGLLALFGRATVRRRTLLPPPPPPLEIADEARRAGLDETVLAEARTRRITTVTVGPDGRLHIEDG
jgi:hypothetical protein